MAKETFRVPVISEALEEAKVPLSPVVRANGFVFVSGMPPFDLKTGKIARGDIVMQTELCLLNVKNALEIASSSLDKVCKVTIYIANSAYYPTVNAIYAKFFPHNPPARTFATVGSWPWEFDIEIECIALA
ncbi:MAG: RidA family protein [Alphaproteobacteria bacterium]|nr:RidA family protein [Alphaproteobacteria bacterium]